MIEEKTTNDWQNTMKNASLFSNAITHGLRTAKNSTVLQYNDIKKNIKKDGFLNNASSRSGIKRKKLEEYDILDNKGLKNIEETIDLYRNLELENRKEYEDFYNSIDSNDFYKVSSTLLYGATSTLLNPIEFTKNMAINTTIGAMTGGAGLVVKFGANMLADTVDNFISNTWEDELLGLKRETSENIVQSIGGALISNAIFPVAKFTGKKILGLSGENIVVKGNTVRDDILDPAVAKQYQKEMAEVTAVDLRYKDSHIANGIKKEYIKAQPNEDGTTRIFLKDEIDNKSTEVRTGIKKGLIDYNYLKEKVLLKTTKEFVKDLKDTQKKLNLPSYEQAIEHTNRVSLEKNAEEFIHLGFATPYTVVKDSYMQNSIAEIKELNDKFMKGVVTRGYLDIISEDLEEKAVSRNLFYNAMNGDNDYKYNFNLKAENIQGYDTEKVNLVFNKKLKDISHSLDNLVSYDTSDIEIMKTIPKYNAYLTDTNNIDIIKSGIVKTVKDYKNKVIDKQDLLAVLGAKKVEYDRYNLTNPDLRTDRSFKQFVNDVSWNNPKKVLLADKIDKIINEELKGFSDEMKEEHYLTKFNELVKDGFVKQEEWGNFREGLSIRKLEAEVDEIVKNKKLSAVLKLGIKKDELLGYLNSKKADELTNELAEKLYVLKLNDNEEIDANYWKKFITALNETTKDVNEIKRSFKEIDPNNEKLDKYDINNFINNFFNGDTKADRVENFLTFAEDFMQDNDKMLNTIYKISMNDKASMSTWGVPMIMVQRAVDEKKGILDILNTIPMMRKNFLDGETRLEDFTDNKGFKVISDTLMEKMGNFIESEKIFTRTKQKDILKDAGDLALGFTRGYLLFGSGVKETLMHPVVAGMKSEKYGGSIEKSIGIAPISVVATTYKALEPAVATSTALHKLYNGIGDLISDKFSKDMDISKELALMELGVNAKDLFSVGNISKWEATKKIAGSSSMYLQNTMQKNRFFSSRLLAISTIKKYLKASNLKQLTPSGQKLLGTLGISDDIKFKEWKSEVNNVSLRKALYEEGVSERTKLIHQMLTKNLYEEDPLAKTKSQTQLNDFSSKVKMMFTSYNRAILSYFSDAIKYVENEDGIYVNRFSSMENLTKGIGTGVKGITVLGLAGLIGNYYQSKLFGDTKDELIASQVDSALGGNLDSAISLGYDIFSNAVPIDTFLTSRGSPLISVGGRLKDGISEVDPLKLTPYKLELFLRNITGERKYKKSYWGMNRDEKRIYDRLIFADKRNNNDPNFLVRSAMDLYDYSLATLFTEKMEADNLITKKEALEIKRQHGFNDREIVNKLNKNGLETVKDYAILNANSDEDVEDIFNIGIEKIAEKNIKKEEIIEELDAVRDTFSDVKTVISLRKDFKLTEQEKVAREKYIKELRDSGSDEFFVEKLLTMYDKKLYNERKNKRG